MTLLNVVTAAFIATVALPAPLMRISASQEPGASKGIEDQLTIALPEGWSVYDQTEAVSGKASALGIVIFSAQAMTKAGETTAGPDVLARVSTGEIASFFVERQKAHKGMTRAKELSKTAVYNIGTMINQDPAVGSVRRAFSGLRPPSHTDIELGGCRGARFVVDAHKDDALKHWTIDVRAVSDGKFLYLFSLGNKADYYAKNLEAFEKANGTVRFKASN
jgi:hypothetical protein